MVNCSYLALSFPDNHLYKRLNIQTFSPFPVLSFIYTSERTSLLPCRFCAFPCSICQYSRPHALFFCRSYPPTNHLYDNFCSVFFYLVFSTYRICCPSLHTHYQLKLTWNSSLFEWQDIWVTSKVWNTKPVAETLKKSLDDLQVCFLVVLSGMLCSLCGLRRQDCFYNNYKYLSMAHSFPTWTCTFCTFPHPILDLPSIPPWVKPGSTLRTLMTR